MASTRIRERAYDKLDKAQDLIYQAKEELTNLSPEDEGFNKTEPFSLMVAAETILIEITSRR